MVFESVSSTSPTVETPSSEQVVENLPDMSKLDESPTTEELQLPEAQQDEQSDQNQNKTDDQV